MYRKVLSLKELDEIMNDPSFAGAEDVDIIILPTDPHSLTDEDEWGIFEKELSIAKMIKTNILVIMDLNNLYLESLSALNINFGLSVVAEGFVSTLTYTLVGQLLRMIISVCKNCFVEYHKK